MAKSAQHNDPDRDDEFDDVDVAAEEGETDAGLSGVKRKTRTSSSAAKPASKSAKSTAGTAADQEPEDEKSSAADEEVGDAGSKRERAAGSSGEDFSLTISRSTLRNAALVLVGLLVLGVLGLGVWQWNSARQQLRAFDEVKAAASHFIVTSIEYTSSDKVDKAKEVQGPLVTGKMREELSQDRAAPSAEIRNQGIKATAKVDSAAVESISRDEATTLMIVTATGTSNLSPATQKRTVALRLQLRREDGKWLVAESKGVGDFSATGSSPAPGAPGAPGVPATPN